MMCANRRSVSSSGVCIGYPLVSALCLSLLPALLAMGADEIKAWIQKLVQGDIEDAYAEILSKMDSPALVDEWTKLNAEWLSANMRNAERLAVQKNALGALVKILLAMALAAVGL